MNRNRKPNSKFEGKKKNYARREQPRKDSRDPRINLDNERVSKASRDMRGDSSDNAVEWYAHNPELLRAAASIPFSQTTGTLFPWANADAKLDSVPGVMAIDWIPTFGPMDLAALNSSKESVYSFVVHANSRNTSYDSSSQMLTILGGMQIFCAIAKANRAYGTMKLFDQTNKYLPKALINAMGFDYEDLQANLSTMWFDINEVIARSQQIWIPNVFPLMERWYWLNSNIYMDSESIKGQYYVFNQEAFLGYTDKVTMLSWMDKNGGMVADSLNSSVDIESMQYSRAQLAGETGTQMTWKKYMTMLNGMLDAMLSSEDRGIIMGDILKAYGPERIYAMSPLPVDYVVTPVYNREVLTQIENASVMNAIYTAIYQKSGSNSLSYYLDNWATGSKPLGETATPDNLLPDMSVLNFHQKEVPTPEQIMVATRLKASGTYFYKGVGKSAKQSFPVTMGTELVTRIAVASYTLGDDDAIPTVKFMDYKAHTDINGDVQALSIELTFDWAPWCYMLKCTPSPYTWGKTEGDITVEIVEACGDYDNYTTISTTELAKMNTTAVYSEFNVPTL